MMAGVSEMPYGGDIPEWTLGWRLQRALAHAGVSVEDMAAEIGVSRSSVSRWLNERGAPPRIGYVRLWAVRTGVSLDWLLAGERSRRQDRERSITERVKVATKYL